MRVHEFKAHGALNTAGSQTVSYYNTCTDWHWLWSNWESADRLGVVFQTSSGATLEATAIDVARPMPMGYGYTGTISIHEVDAAGCPIEPPLAAQPFAPRSGWWLQTWGISVGGTWAAVVTLANRPNNPIQFYSDHPAPRGTGPIACGTCYPRNRPTRSFYYGPTTAPLCPGEGFFDGFCNAELMWYAQVSIPTTVESSSWGSVKALYE